MKTTELFKIFTEVFDAGPQTPPSFLKIPLSMLLYSSGNTFEATINQYIYLLFDYKEQTNKTFFFLNKSYKTDLLNPTKMEFRHNEIYDLIKILARNNQFNRFLLYHDFPEELLRAEEINNIIAHFDRDASGSEQKKLNNIKNINDNLNTDKQSILIFLSENEDFKNFITNILETNFFQSPIYHCNLQKYFAILDTKNTCISIGEYLSNEKSLDMFTFDLFLCDLI